MDRLEVSNARHEPFARLAAITHYGVHSYPGVLARAGEADSPVTSIDAFAAEAYCRYLGKRLPTDEEWTKAARGGLIVDGQPNPAPKRLFPWGTDWRPCANVAGDADGYKWVAPVESFACGASPYLVLNLAGNVQEWVAASDSVSDADLRAVRSWISSTGQTSDAELRVVRGGAPNSPLESEHATTVFRNPRAARYFDFSIGVRCVADADPKVGSTWRRH